MRYAGRAWTALIVLQAAWWLPTGLQGQEGPDDGWQFAVTPWLWLVGLSGTVEVRDQGFEFGMDTGEVFDALEFGLMARLEAEKGKLSLFAEPVWSELGGSGSVDTPLGTANASVSLDMLLLDLGAGYRVVGPVQVVAGGRYLGTSVDADIVNQSGGGDSDIWNAFVGARVRHLLSDRLGVLLHGDVGFGDAESNYALQGAVQYRPIPWLGLDLGYKWLHYGLVEETSGLRRADLDLYGGVVGASFVF